MNRFANHSNTVKCPIIPNKLKELMQRKLKPHFLAKKKIKIKIKKTQGKKQKNNKKKTTHTL